jgi:hypothetical protein
MIDVGAVTLEAWRQYMATGLWSSLDDDGEPLITRFDPDGIAPASQAKMLYEVAGFVAGCLAERPDVFDGIDAGQIGHDFWLTRNRHGAGFWDRGLGERGQWLTDMARPSGECSLYVGDDGQVHYDQ